MTNAEREEQRQTLASLRRDARLLARAFELELASVEAEHPRVRQRLGVCYDDGSIKIRLRNLRTGQLLKYSSLVDTLCHELAHLRHLDHGRAFERLYQRILEYARRQGVYRPGPRSRRGRLDSPSTPDPVVLRGSSILPQRRRSPPVARPARDRKGAAGPAQLDLFR